MQDLVILTPHLVDKIRAIVAADIDIPEELRAQLQEGLGRFETAQEEKRQTEVNKNDDDDDEQGPAIPEKKPIPPTIDILALEHLSRWISEGTASKLKDKRIDPVEYGLIPLLSGTELYLPGTQLPIPSSSESTNPYLPAYLSPLPPSFGSEYRSLTRQLSTVLNILFSIFGSGFAVYVAATTGGGYAREKGILLGILAGVVVGIADGVLVCIFGQRVREGREEGRKLAIKLARGSGGDGVNLDGDVTAEERESIAGELDEKVLEVEAVAEVILEKKVPPVKKDIRLRRRAIGEKPSSL
jgi:hypothetical protein